MPRRRLAALALLALVAVPAAGLARAEDPAPPPAPAPFDRVRVRREMLARMDAKIDEDAAKAHLAARVLLDETLPLPYLGVDADPAPGGMRVTKVYPATGAEAAGLREGDVIASVDGLATDSTAALGRAIRAHEVGETLVFRFVRDGKEAEARSVLGKRPEEDEDEDEQFAYADGVAAEGTATPVALDFETEKTGGTSIALEPLLGGHGRPPRFVVAKDGDARFVRQEDDDPTGIRFPMAWVRGFAARDVVATARFRLVSGRQDRAAGIVVRGENAWTYLVARVNAVEGDLRVFRVAEGLRRTLPGARARVALAEGWHTLRVVAHGAEVTATLDETTAVTGHDTFVRGGRVGLWTKSDGVADFDDLRAEAFAAPK